MRLVGLYQETDSVRRGDQEAGRMRSGWEDIIPSLLGLASPVRITEEAASRGSLGLSLSL